MMPPAGAVEEGVVAVDGVLVVEGVAVEGAAEMGEEVPCQS